MSATTDIHDDDTMEYEDYEMAVLKDAVNDLLDCVERPVGTLVATIPDTPAAQRAIVALFDAMGRGL